MSETTLGSLAQSGVLSLGDGYRTRQSELDHDGFRIIRVADIKGGRISLDSPDFVSARFERQIGAKRATAGDVLLTTKGTVGRVAIVPESTTRAVYSPQLCWFRVADPSVLAPRYLAYWLQSDGFLAQSSHMQVNTDMAPYISLSDLRSAKIVLPSSSEQQAIAEVLGALDDKIAANTALAEKADSLASLTYDETSAPWPRVPMSSVLNPILGGTPARARDDYWADGDQLWISARDITSAPNRVVTDTAEKITLGAVAGTKAKALPSGSVILTARGTVGEVARLARPASFNQSCYGFRPDVVPPGLLYFSILRATERAKAVAHGSVFDTITKATFDHLELAWDGGQAASAEDVIAPILDVVSAAVSENRVLAATRDALLPQLMSGKLRVRDAENAVAKVGV